MSARSFTSSICKQIIERVRSRPEIWQFSHPLYKRRGVQQQFWEELAMELGVNEQVLKKRWKHLKDQYRKELKRAIEKGDEDTVRWQYFKLFSFYKDEILHRNSQRAVAAAIDADSSENTDEETEKPEIKKSLSSVLERVRVLKKKRDDSAKINIILKRLTQTKSLLQTKMEELETRNTDPDYMFLLSLMPSIKRLTEIQKLQLKARINNWLLETFNVDNTPYTHTVHVVCDDVIEECDDVIEESDDVIEECDDVIEQGDDDDDDIPTVMEIIKCESESD